MTPHWVSHMIDLNTLDARALLKSALYRLSPMEIMQLCGERGEQGMLHIVNQFLASVKDYDDRMDAGPDPQAPTGDDYNELFGHAALLKQQLINAGFLPRT